MSSGQLRWEVIIPILLMVFCALWFAFHLGNFSLPWLWAFGTTVLLALAAALIITILILGSIY